MQKIFFDSGPIITLVMSRLAWILPEIKKKFNGRFLLTPSVKRELVERPLQVRRFQFEALEVEKLIRDGVFEVYQEIPKEKIKELIVLANSSFKSDKKTLDVVQEGEIASLVCALETNAAAVVIDERTIRLFIEGREQMKSLLERRFKRKVLTEENQMRNFSEKFKKINIIRSVELIGVAFKMGLLNDYLSQGKSCLLNAVLWAAKYNGCAVTEHEIEELKNYLLKR